MYSLTRSFTPSSHCSVVSVWICFCEEFLMWTQHTFIFTLSSNLTSCLPVYLLLSHPLNFAFLGHMGILCRRKWMKQRLSFASDVFREYNLQGSLERLLIHRSAHCIEERALMRQRSWCWDRLTGLDTVPLCFFPVRLEPFWSHKSLARFQRLHPNGPLNNQQNATLALCVSGEQPCSSRTVFQVPIHVNSNKLQTDAL